MNWILASLFLEHSVVVVVAFIQSGGHKTKQHIKYMQEYSPKQKNETEMFSDNHARNESVDRSSVNEDYQVRCVSSACGRGLGQDKLEVVAPFIPPYLRAWWVVEH